MIPLYNVVALKLFLQNVNGKRNVLKSDLVQMHLNVLKLTLRNE